MANKYLYEIILQGNYGYGWDDLTAHDTKREARAEMRVYRDNQPGAYRIIERRTPNPAYRETTKPRKKRYKTSTTLKRYLEGPRSGRWGFGP